MWKGNKIELIKNIDTWHESKNYFKECYTLKINGVQISNCIPKSLKIDSPLYFQDSVCDYCGEPGCNGGGMLSIRRHRKSLLFIPCFEDLDGEYLEYDSNAEETGYSDTPPHEWYEHGILEIDENVLPDFLKVLDGFDISKIPFATEKEMDQILDWENLVKEKPEGFMRNIKEEEK